MGQQIVLLLKTLDDPAGKLFILFRQGLNGESPHVKVHAGCIPLDELSERWDPVRVPDGHVVDSIQVAPQSADGCNKSLGARNLQVPCRF